MSEPADIFADLRELQVQRKHYIAQQVSIENRTRALVQRALGWRPDLTEKKSAALKTKAAAILSAAFAGKKTALDDQIGNILAVDRQMLAPVIAARKAIEKRMAALARALPAYDFVKTVKGFGDLAFAVLIGETGDLANYSAKAKLFKRCGLLTMFGEACSTWRSRKKNEGLTTAEWQIAGYAPKRLAQLVGCITDPLVKWKAHSRYGEIYATRKARTAAAHPEWTKKHVDNDARRIILKALLADLWSAWPRANDSVNTMTNIRAVQVSDGAHSAIDSVGHDPLEHHGSNPDGDSLIGAGGALPRGHGAASGAPLTEADLMREADHAAPVDGHKGRYDQLVHPIDGRCGGVASAPAAGN